MALKLVILALKLIPLAIFCWRRITLGPKASFVSFPNTQTNTVENAHGAAEIRELCSKIGWPIEAWVQLALQRSRLFELSPQRTFSIATDLQVGVPGFDERFFIGSESQHFIRALAASSDLRAHFAILPNRLDTYQAKLVRIRAEGRELAIQCNVRWTKDRSALYLALLVWMQALDILLSMESTQKTKNYFDSKQAIRRVKSSQAKPEKRVL